MEFDPNDSTDHGATDDPVESDLISAAVDGDFRDEVWDSLRELAKSDEAVWARFAETYRADLALRDAVAAVGAFGGDTAPTPEAVAARAPKRRVEMQAWMGWAAALVLFALQLSSFVSTSPSDRGGVASSGGSDGSPPSEVDAAPGSGRTGFVVVRPKNGSGLRVGRMAVDDLGRPSVVPVANRGVVRVESM